MKWFKHDSQAHNDEKIRELIHEFGVEGYGIYIILLELIAEKIDKKLDPTITISDRVLREKLRVSRGKLTRILAYFGENLLTFSKVESGNWIINCPNILKRLDNWTSNSQVTYKQPSTQPEVEPELKNKNQNLNPGSDGFFNEKQKQIVLSDISKSYGVAENSESAKLRLESIIAEVAKVKDVKNPLALARHKAIKQK